MAWLTVDDVHRLLGSPQCIAFSIYDAAGNRVMRRVTGFDPDTGEVESFVVDPQGRLPGRHVMPSRYIEHPEGEYMCQKEHFPAPLTFAGVTPTQAKLYKHEQEQYESISTEFEDNVTRYMVQVSIEIKQPRQMIHGTTA